MGERARWSSRVTFILAAIGSAVGLGNAWRFPGLAAKHGVGTLNPFRYRTYYYDTETGFYYLNSRYYDPETGRFVNGDAVMGAPGDVTGVNLFAYCRNNPVNRADPTGLWCPEGDGRNERHNANYGYIIPKCAQSKTDLGLIDGFRNPDGTYSLHDNYRASPGQKFHERLLECKYYKPEFSLSDLKFGLGGAGVTLMTGSWETEYVDFSLLNIGEAKVSARVDHLKLDLCAMASIYSPSISIKLSDYTIVISGHFGSVGLMAYADNGMVSVGGACGWGCQVAIIKT